MRTLLFLLLCCGLGCGPRVTTMATPLSFCSASSLSCLSGDVPATTELARGTPLTRAECDVACGSLMCPAEQKTCSVVAGPLGGAAVRCLSAFIPGRDPLCPQAGPTP